MEQKRSYGRCRCCLSKGNHRDIMQEYYKSGTREVYYDIFMECYNLFLSSNPSLGTLICSACVRRLRAASEFRTMVVDTEQRLLQALGDQETVFINVRDPTLEDLDIKIENPVYVKEEPCDEIEISVEYNSDVDDGQCGPYQMSSPSAEDQDLIEGEAELLARFPPGSLRPLPTREDLYTICPGYARQLDLLRDKIILPKSIEKQLKEGYNRAPHRTKAYVTEKLAQITNASVLIEFSNVTPFKSRSRYGFPCFYCRTTFETLIKLQEHQKCHRKNEIRKILKTYGSEALVVYVDVTNLKCTICNETILNLNELKNHLTKKHKKIMHLEFTDRVIPFKLSESNVFECQICGFNFETFGSMERHMNIHYRNHVCNECGTGFITKYRLKVHVKSMHIGGSFPCELCNKVYTTQQKHKNHVDTVHKLVKRFKCPKCPERFSEYFRRQKHMVSVHGVAPLRYKCNVCDKSFDRRYTLSRHLKRDHLEERDFQCEMCSYKCFTNNELRVHMVKHNGERVYECGICKKAYARKKTLKEHMRIHNNDRRFTCAVCGQAFVQKCSLKGHIKTHHVEYTLTDS